MSGKISGACWEFDLPNSEMLILQAMADHADHEGRNVRPSMSLIAWKTGYQERHVRRIVTGLEEQGILVPEEVRAGHTTLYRIDLSRAKHKAPFVTKRGRPRAAVAAPPADPKAVPENPGHPRKDASENPGHLDTPTEKPRTFEQKTPDICDKTPDICDKTPDISGPPHCMYARGTVLETKEEPLQQQEPSRRQESAPGPATDPQRADSPQTAATAARFAFVSRILKELAALEVVTSQDTIGRFVAEYGEEAVADQVRWLPRRSACNIRVLAAALKTPYGDPDVECPPSAPKRQPGRLDAGRVAHEIDRVTRIGTCRLRKGELLAEISRHGQAVVLKEMVEYHEQCRREGKPDDDLRLQRRMIEMLANLSADAIASELSESPARETR